MTRCSDDERPQERLPTDNGPPSQLACRPPAGVHRHCEPACKRVGRDSVQTGAGADTTTTTRPPSVRACSILSIVIACIEVLAWVCEASGWMSSAEAQAEQFRLPPSPPCLKIGIPVVIPSDSTQWTRDTRGRSAGPARRCRTVDRGRLGRREAAAGGL